MKKITKVVSFVVLAIWLSASYAVSAPLDKINLGGYVTDFTGKTDQTTAVLAAEAEAFRLNLPLFHPGGTILSGYVNFRVPLFGNPGYRNVRPIFKTTVNDGSAAFETTSMSIDNIQFLGSTSSSAGPKNAIGLVAGQGYYPSINTTAVGSLSRGHLTNVTISGFTTGFKGFGWINKIDGMLINYCTLGALFDTYNGALIDLTGEQNHQDFILYHSNGVHFTRLLLEGTVGDTPSIIDASTSVQIDGLYLEQHERFVPWIQLGNTYTARDVTANGIVERCGLNCNPINPVKSTGYTSKIYLIGN